MVKNYHFCIEGMIITSPWPLRPWRPYSFHPRSSGNDGILPSAKDTCPSRRGFTLLPSGHRSAKTCQPKSAPPLFMSNDIQIGRDGASWLEPIKMLPSSSYERPPSRLSPLMWRPNSIAHIDGSRLFSDNELLKVEDAGRVTQVDFLIVNGSVAWNVLEGWSKLD